MACRINDQDFPQPPFGEGTIVMFDAGEGRYIRLRSADEARDLAAAASVVAENWIAPAE